MRRIFRVVAALTSCAGLASHQGIETAPGSYPMLPKGNKANPWSDTTGTVAFAALEATA